MDLKEVVLLYNIKDERRYGLYQSLFQSLQIELKHITKDKSALPVGLLAYGSKEQIEDYLQDSSGTNTCPAGSAPDDQSEKELKNPKECLNREFPEEAMMVLAGFTDARLTSVLEALREQGLNDISLKAVLTEYNAVWDSMTLYRQLAEERAQFCS